MLKISIVEAPGDTVTLRLDGIVTGRWVKCLEQSCEAEMKKHAGISVDMSNVSFVDRAGILLLRNLAVCGIEIMKPLPFIAEQIKSAISS